MSQYLGTLQWVLQFSRSAILGRFLDFQSDLGLFWLDRKLGCIIRKNLRFVIFLFSQCGWFLCATCKLTWELWVWIFRIGAITLWKCFNIMFLQNLELKIRGLFLILNENRQKLAIKSVCFCLSNYASISSIQRGKEPMFLSRNKPAGTSH